MTAERIPDLRITTRVSPDGVNALLVGEFIRLVRRTVRPSDEGVYDVEMEFDRFREVDPGGTDAERVRWLVAGYE